MLITQPFSTQLPLYSERRRSKSVHAVYDMVIRVAPENPARRAHPFWAGRARHYRSYRAPMTHSGAVLLLRKTIKPSARKGAQLDLVTGSDVETAEIRWRTAQRRIAHLATDLRHMRYDLIWQSGAVSTIGGSTASPCELRSKRSTWPVARHSIGVSRKSGVSQAGGGGSRVVVQTNRRTARHWRSAGRFTASYPQILVVQPLNTWFAQINRPRAIRRTRTINGTKSRYKARAQWGDCCKRYPTASNSGFRWFSDSLDRRVSYAAADSVPAVRFLRGAAARMTGSEAWRQAGNGQ